MTSRGFSLVELLVALTVCALVSGAIAAAIQPARDVFERTPAAIDLEQRGRTALDVLAAAVRSSGRTVVAAHALGAMADILPSTLLDDPDASGRRFSRLTTIAPVINPGQAVLGFDQAGPGGSLMLAAAWCPEVSDVCGFRPGMTVAVADGTGRYDLGQIAGTNRALGRLALAASLSHAYPAGALVVEVEAFTFRLDEQPDGTLTLVRVTAAGAIQPVIDGASQLWFEPETVAGRVRRIGMSVRVAPLAPRHAAPQARTFRTTVTLRNVP
jgi:prepilin-type N-terminal cleavage/methylation domain-containing protein